MSETEMIGPPFLCAGSEMGWGQGAAGAVVHFISPPDVRMWKCVHTAGAEVGKGKYGLGRIKQNLFSLCGSDIHFPSPDSMKGGVLAQQS